MYTAAKQAFSILMKDYAIKILILKTQHEGNFCSKKSASPCLTQVFCLSNPSSDNYIACSGQKMLCVELISMSAALKPLLAPTFPTISGKCMSVISDTCFSEKKKLKQKCG